MAKTRWRPDLLRRSQIVARRNNPTLNVPPLSKTCWVQRKKIEALDLFWQDRKTFTLGGFAQTVI